MKKNDSDGDRAKDSEENVTNTNTLHIQQPTYYIQN